MAACAPSGSRRNCWWSTPPASRAEGPEALEVAARRGEGEDVPRTTAPTRGSSTTTPPGHLMPELKAQQIELGTRVCTDLADVEKELRHLAGPRRGRRERGRRPRRRAGHLAGRRRPGGRPRGSGTPAWSTPSARTAREVLTCGCHVHVSIADDEEGVAVLNRIRVWLPVLTALTANSPFWQGEDTGYASYRSQVWLRWPSAGPDRAVRRRRRLPPAGRRRARHRAPCSTPA